MTIVTLNNVTKSFKGNVVLDNICFSFDAGTIYVIRGDNGTGKSVLLKVAAGLMRPTSGSVVLDAAIQLTRAKYPADIGLIVDGPGYFPDLSAKDNLLCFASFRKVVQEREILNIMADFHLDANNPTKAANLSLGNKQKIGLCQALMERPKLLLLDEPFNALDTASTKVLKSYLSQARDRGACILLTTHRDHDIAGLITSDLLLNSGQLCP